MISQAKPQPDGSLAVNVELPLRRLWEIVRRGMTYVEVYPPDEPPSASQPADEESP